MTIPELRSKASFIVFLSYKSNVSTFKNWISDLISLWLFYVEQFTRILSTCTLAEMMTKNVLELELE
jgi:hypothetical protein